MDYCRHYLNLLSTFRIMHQLGEDVVTPDGFLWIKASDQFPLLMGVWADTSLFVELRLGRPDAAVEAELFREAMKASWFGESLNGARLAVNPETEELVLLDIRPAERIADAAALTAWFEEMAEAAGPWQAKLTERSTPAPVPTTPSPNRENRDWMTGRLGGAFA